jgi:ribosomal protein S18 acetylase RimI-like enzyme
VGAGRCASLLAPRLERWDDETASRLIRESARGAAAEGARLIQAIAEPDDRGALGRVLERAGLERLAVLAYLRRKVAPSEAALEAPENLRFRRWAPWRRTRFAAVLERSYEGSLDCPAMAGLRTARDAIATHRATGLFRPGAWHLAIEGREPVGVVLVNVLQGRGDITYLGVVPEARQRGIGRALLAQAIRDTARMHLPVLGLAVDTENTPAVRLYTAAGFEEVRRRLVWFIPKERLDTLDA